MFLEVQVNAGLWGLYGTGDREVCISNFKL